MSVAHILTAFLSGGLHTKEELRDQRISLSLAHARISSWLGVCPAYSQTHSSHLTHSVQELWRSHVQPGDEGIAACRHKDGAVSRFFCALVCMFFFFRIQELKHLAHLDTLCTHHRFGSSLQVRSSVNSPDNPPVHLRRCHSSHNECRYSTDCPPTEGCIGVREPYDTSACDCKVEDVVCRHWYAPLAHHFRAPVCRLIRLSCSVL